MTNLVSLDGPEYTEETYVNRKVASLKGNHWLTALILWPGEPQKQAEYIWTRIHSDALGKVTDENKRKDRKHHRRAGSGASGIGAGDNQS